MYILASCTKNTLFSARAKLRDSKLSLIDSKGDPKFPAFLYDEDTMDGSLVKGLFRSRLLLAVSSCRPYTRVLSNARFQVYTHIFVAPSAATGAKASLKRGNAKIHGMEKAIPSTICYTAIQVSSNLQNITLTKSNGTGPLGVRRIVLLRRMERRMEGCQFCTPLYAPSRAIRVPGRPLVL